MFGLVVKMSVSLLRGSDVIPASHIYRSWETAVMTQEIKFLLLTWKLYEVADLPALGDSAQFWLLGTFG